MRRLLRDGEDFKKRTSLRRILRTLQMLPYKSFDVDQLSLLIVLLEAEQRVHIAEKPSHRYY